GRYEVGKAALRRCKVRGFAGVERLHVLARAEDGAFAGEHADPQVLVGFEPVDGGFDAACDGAVDGVTRFGTVYGDDGDVAADFEIDHLRASGWFPASGVRDAQQVAQMPAIVNERRKPGLSRF